MNIAIDARESGTSTGRYVDKLIENLAKLDTDIDFTVLTKPHRLDFIRSIAPDFKVIEADIKEFTFAEQLAFMRLLNGLNVDLVHFSMVQQPVRYKGKVVTTIHDLTMTWENNPSRNFIIHSVKRQVYKQVIKIAVRKSRAVITPSKFVKNDVIRFSGQSGNKFQVTYEGADRIKDEAKPLEELVNKQFIMYVGRPMPHKNLERLIDAFALVKNHNPSLHLVLAGKKDSNYQRIESMVKAKGIKNIVFSGFITDGQLRWLYQNCRAYVFPSLSEGFGLPGLEAMIHGAPVISSNATCLPEIYEDGAIYFDPYDVQAIADTITKVLEDNELRQDLIRKGSEQAKKYSWAKMAEQTLKVYQSLLN